MNIDNSMIDEIVARVMDHLRSNGRATLDTAPAAVAKSCPVLRDSVLTESTLKEQLGGSHQIVIGRSTVLTPSAIDLLHARRIRWTREPLSTAAAGLQTGDTATNRRAAWRLIAIRPSRTVQSLMQELTRSNETHWTTSSGDTPIQAAQHTIEAVTRSRSGVVVVGQAALVCCLANRNEHVRAAVVTDPADVRQVVAAMGTNAFCVDAAATGSMQLRNLIRTIEACGLVRPPSISSE